MRRRLNLDIAAGAEIELLPGREFEDQLLDKGGAVGVGADFTAPLADGKDLRRQLQRQILLDPDLAGQTITFPRHPFVDMGGLGRQDITAAGRNLHLALTAGAAAATSGRDKDLMVGEDGQQLAAGRDGDALGRITIDGEDDLPLREKTGAGQQDQGDQRHDNPGKHQDAEEDGAHN